MASGVHRILTTDQPEYEPPEWSRTLAYHVPSWGQSVPRASDVAPASAQTGFPIRMNLDLMSDDPLAGVAGPLPPELMVQLGAQAGEQRGGFYRGLATAPITLANFPTYGREGGIALLTSVLGKDYQQRPGALIGEETPIAGSDPLDLGIFALRQVGNVVDAPFRAAADWWRDSNNLNRAKQVRQLAQTGSATPFAVDWIVGSIFPGEADRFTYQKLYEKAQAEGIDVVDMLSTAYDISPSIVSQILTNPNLSDEALGELMRGQPISLDPGVALANEGAFFMGTLAVGAFAGGGLGAIGKAIGLGARAGAGLEAGMAAARTAQLAKAGTRFQGLLGPSSVPGRFGAEVARGALEAGGRLSAVGGTAGRALSLGAGITRGALKANALMTTSGWTIRGLELGIKQAAGMLGNQELVDMMDRLLWQMPLSMNPGLNLIDGFGFRMTSPLRVARIAAGSRRVEALEVSIGRQGTMGYVGGIGTDATGRYVRIGGREVRIGDQTDAARAIVRLREMTPEQLHTSFFSKVGWSFDRLDEMFGPGNPRGLTWDDARNTVLYLALQTVREAKGELGRFEGAHLPDIRARSEEFWMQNAARALQVLDDEFSGRSSAMAKLIKGQFWTLDKLNDSDMAATKARLEATYLPDIALSDFVSWTAASKILRQAIERGDEPTTAVLGYRRTVNLDYLATFRQHLADTYQPKDVVKVGDIELLRRYGGAVESQGKGSRLRNKGRTYTRTEVEEILTDIEAKVRGEMAKAERAEAAVFKPGRAVGDVFEEARVLGIATDQLDAIRRMRELPTEQLPPPGRGILEAVARATGRTADEILAQGPQKAWQDIFAWVDERLAQATDTALMRDRLTSFEQAVATLPDDSLRVSATRALRRINDELLNPLSPRHRLENESKAWRWDRAHEAARALVARIDSHVRKPERRLSVVASGEQRWGTTSALPSDVLTDIDALARKVAGDADAPIRDADRTLLASDVHPLSKLEALQRSVDPPDAQALAATLARAGMDSEGGTAAIVGDMRAILGLDETATADDVLARASAAADAYAREASDIAAESVLVADRFRAVDGLVSDETMMLLERMVAYADQRRRTSKQPYYVLDDDLDPAAQPQRLRRQAVREAEAEAARATERLDEANARLANAGQGDVHWENAPGRLPETGEPYYLVGRGKSAYRSDPADMPGGRTAKQKKEAEANRRAADIHARTGLPAKAVYVGGGVYEVKVGRYGPAPEPPTVRPLVSERGIQYGRQGTVVPDRSTPAMPLDEVDAVLDRLYTEPDPFVGLEERIGISQGFPQATPEYLDSLRARVVQRQAEVAAHDVKPGPAYTETLDALVKAIDDEAKARLTGREGVIETAMREGRVEESQAANVEVGVERGGTPESGGAIRAEQPIDAPVPDWVRQNREQALARIPQELQTHIADLSRTRTAKEVLAVLEAEGVQLGDDALDTIRTVRSAAGVEALGPGGVGGGSAVRPEMVQPEQPIDVAARLEGEPVPDVPDVPDLIAEAGIARRNADAYRTQARIWRREKGSIEDARDPVTGEPIAATSKAAGIRLMEQRGDEWMARSEALQRQAEDAARAQPVPGVPDVPDVSAPDANAAPPGGIEPAVLDELVADAAARESGLPQPGPLYGKETAFPDRAPTDPFVPARFRVVDIDELAVQGPDSPLQPRDRAGRAASKEQVRGISREFRPELAFRTESGAHGPQVISSDLRVVAGNGRTLAMREMGPEQWATYRAMLLERADEFGIDPAQVDMIERPVLVREIPDEYVTPEMAAWLNAETGAMAPAEMAVAIARQMSPEDIAAIGELGETVTLRDALTQPSKAPFVRRVLDALPEQQRATFMDADGNLSAEGAKMLSDALLARMIPAPDVVSKLIEHPEVGTRFRNALEMSLGKVLVAEERLHLATGIDAEPIGEVLADAMRIVLGRLEAGMSIKDLRGDLMTEGLFEVTRGDKLALALAMTDNQNEMAAILRGYARATEAAMQEGMFDQALPSLSQRINAGIDDVNVSRMFDQIPRLPETDSITIHPFTDTAGNPARAIEVPVASVDDAIDARIPRIDRFDQSPPADVLRHAPDGPFTWILRSEAEADAMRRWLAGDDTAWRGDPVRVEHDGTVAYPTDPGPVPDEWLELRRRFGGREDVTITAADDAPAGTTLVSRTAQEVDPDFPANAGFDPDLGPDVRRVQAAADSGQPVVVSPTDPVTQRVAQTAVGAPRVRQPAGLLIINEPDTATMLRVAQEDLAAAQARHATATEALARVRAEADIPDGTPLDATTLDQWDRYVGGTLHPTTMGAVHEVLESIDAGFPPAGAMEASEVIALRNSLLAAAHRRLDGLGAQRVNRAGRPFQPDPTVMIRNEDLGAALRAVDEEIQRRIITDDASPMEGWEGTQYEVVPAPRQYSATGELLAPRILPDDYLSRLDDIVPGLADEILSGRKRSWAQRVEDTHSSFLMRALDHVVGARSERELTRAAIDNFANELLSYLPDAQSFTPQELARMRSQVRGMISHVHLKMVENTTGWGGFLGLPSVAKYRRVGQVPRETLERWFREAIGDDRPAWFDRILVEAETTGQKFPLAEAWRLSDNRVRQFFRDRPGPIASWIENAYAGGLGQWSHDQAVALGTLYNAFRFAFDARWIALEKTEAFILTLGKEGWEAVQDARNMTPDRMPLAFGVDDLARQRTEWAWWLGIMDTGGWNRARERYIMALMKRRQGREFPSILKEMAKQDEALAEMIRLSGHTEDQWLAQLSQDITMLAERGRFHPEAEMRVRLDPYLKRGVISQKEFDDALARGYWTDIPSLDAEIAYAAGTPVQPLLERLAFLNQQYWQDSASLIFGQVDRSNLQRLFNHPMLYWPLSYQIKATKWLAGLMLDQVGGLPTGALGAVTLGRLHEQHKEWVATVPGYAERMASNRNLLFMAQMILPITPWDIGVSLSPFTRLAMAFITGDASYTRNLFGVGPGYTYFEQLPRVLREQSREDALLQGVPIVSDVVRRAQVAFPFRPPAGPVGLGRPSTTSGSQAADRRLFGDQPLPQEPPPVAQPRYGP